MLPDFMIEMDQTAASGELLMFSCPQFQICTERSNLQSLWCDELSDGQEGIQDAGIATAENSAQHTQQGWQVSGILFIYIMALNTNL